MAGGASAIRVVGRALARVAGERWARDRESVFLRFGPLSLLSEGPSLEIDGLHIPMPRPSGVAVEKLIADRSGEKGNRDLLVLAGLLCHMSETDVAHVPVLIRRLT